MYRLPFLRLIRPRGYSPVGPGGVEPPIASLSGKCLNRLGHRPVAEAGVFETQCSRTHPGSNRCPAPARFSFHYRPSTACSSAEAAPYTGPERKTEVSIPSPFRDPAAFGAVASACQLHFPGGPACAGWLRPRTGRRRTESTIPSPRERAQPLSKRCPAPARFILHALRSCHGRSNAVPGPVSGTGLEAR